jgi:hypothetical protein
MAFTDQLLQLSRLLYPSGRAFKMPFGGASEKLHRGLIASEARLLDDARALFDAIIADNSNYTADDASAWEVRLGIAASSSTSLADRKKAINQKLNYPGTNGPRQHYVFIQDQLRAAGFDVYIWENKFLGPVTKTPEQVLGTTTGSAYHATTLQHATGLQHGNTFSNKIANYVEERRDAPYVVSDYRFTFFVTGSDSSITTFASIPEARKDEFRQLLLMLKPAHTVGFLFVNYV